jgi:hypothetical protein
MGKVYLVVRDKIPEEMKNRLKIKFSSSENDI